MNIAPLHRQPLTEEQFSLSLEYMRGSGALACRDELILTLAVMAGLRANEIAGLKLAAMTDADGRIASEIYIEKHLTKYGPARRIVMPVRVREALIRFRAAFPEADALCDVLDERSASVIRKFLTAIYAAIGYSDHPTASVLRCLPALDGPTSKPAPAIPTPEPSPPAKRTRAAIRNADVFRAIKAVERAGLAVTATEIRSDGTIKLSHNPDVASPTKAYDKWKQQRDAHSA